MPLAVGRLLGAQGAATVPASSLVYDKLESITAYYPVPGSFLGERPLSRRQIEREVARLSASVDSSTAGEGSSRRAWALRELASVRDALSDEANNRGERTRAAWSWRADAGVGSAQPLRITPNGLGLIDALTQPFEARRDGWPLVDGTSTNIAPTVVMGSGDWFAIAAEPLWSRTQARRGITTNSVSLHRGYARATFRNVAVRAGADEMLWGQSPLSALFISGNASPLPAVVVGTDTAITLPWLFRLGGPARATLFLADLGRSQNPPHAKLAGWQVSIMPWSRFELGVSVLAHTGGGDSIPSATFVEHVADLFPVIGAAFPKYNKPISNKLAGGNLRLRLPELSGLDLYYELQVDDFDARRFRSSFVDDAGHLLGARLPIITSKGQLVWRGEWHRTSLRLYEHTQFTSGVTYRGKIIGDPLGANAKAGYLSGTWQFSPLNAIQLSLADERRDPSFYHTTSNDTHDRGFRFVLDSVFPDHRRNRVTASLDRTVSFGAMRLTLGYDRAWRTGGIGRNEWLGLVALTSRRLRTF